MRESSKASWVRHHAGMLWLGLCVASGPGCEADSAQRWMIEPAPGALSNSAEAGAACRQPMQRVATHNPRCPDGTYQGDVVLNDSRISQLQGCVYIAGNVRVETSARRDLVGLESLRRIEGSLEVAAAPSAGPVSLRGLANLECVSGDLTLGPDWGVGTLRDLRGLDRLRAVRALRVQNLPALEDLQGLSALEEAERIDVIGCDNLASLAGLDALRVVHGRLRVSHNATLNTLSGVPRLQAVRELVLEDNAALENLQGLSRDVSELLALSVERNASLLTLDGLEALTQIQQLFVSDNPRLERLAHFENLRAIDAFEVADHPRLTDLGELPRLEDNPQLELTLRNNKRLTSICGLERITQAYNVKITGNDALSDLSCWQVQHVNNFMLLSANASLTHLDGLEALRDVSHLRVQANPQLIDLDGLSELKRGGVVEVLNNLALRTAFQRERQVSANEVQ